MKKFREAGHLPNEDYLSDEQATAFDLNRSARPGKKIWSDHHHHHQQSISNNRLGAMLGLRGSYHRKKVSEKYDAYFGIAYDKEDLYD